MNDQNLPIIISFPKSTKFLTLFLFGILIFLGGYLILDAFKIEYIQFIPLLIGILVIIGAFLILDHGSKKIIIEKELIISSTFFFKKKLELNEISGFTEITPKSSKTKKPSKVFYIYTKDLKYIKLIADNWGSEYEAVKDILKPLAPKNFNEIHQHFHEIRFRFYKGIGYLFGFIIIIYSLVNIYNAKEIDRTELGYVKGTLANQIVISKRKNRVNTIKIKLNEYSKFDFEVTGQRVNLVDNEIIDISVGDSIFLLVNNNEKEVKLENNSSNSNIYQRSIDWLKIEVCEISTAKYDFLSLEKVNSQEKDLGQKILLLLFGVLAILYFKFISKGYD